MLKKTKGIFNTIERYFGRVFIKLERVEGSFENSFGVCSIKIFTNFWAILIMNH